MRKKMIIIGSGLGGLAVACRLAAHGHNVIIFEKNNWAGGCCSGFRKKGFQFSRGPIHFSDPETINELFEYAGVNRNDYFSIKHVEPIFRIFDRLGQTFDFSSENQDITGQIEKISLEDLDSLVRYSRFMSKHYEISQSKRSIKSFQPNDPFKFQDRSKGSIYDFSANQFQNPFLKSVFSYFPLYYGNNPLESLSPFLAAQFHGTNKRFFSIAGGMQLLPQAILKIYQDFGGEIEYNANVKEIIFRNGRASGIRLANGEMHFGDMIISNMDSFSTLESLLPASFSDRIRKFKSCASLFSIHLGMREKLNAPKILHQNILIPGNMAKFSGQIFDEKVVSGDFSIVINRPVREDLSLAPENRDLLQIHALVPDTTANIDWNKISRIYRNRILSYIESQFSVDIRSNILLEYTVTPDDYQSTFNHFNGSPFSAQMTAVQSGKKRPGITPLSVRSNLFLVGAGISGPGIPVVLENAKQTAELIIHHCD